MKICFRCALTYHYTIQGFQALLLVGNDHTIAFKSIISITYDVKIVYSLQLDVLKLREPPRHPPADCLKVVVLAQLSRARAHELIMSMLVGLIRSMLVGLIMSMLMMAGRSM